MKPPDTGIRCDAPKTPVRPRSKSPSIAEIVINRDCNSNCLFCGKSSRSRNIQRMSTVEVEDSLSCEYRKGCRSVSFAGGEPTINENLFEYVFMAKTMGYSEIGIQTNALRLCDHGYARDLASAGINQFSVSIHGHEPGIYDRLSGVKGGFKKMLRAVGNLRKLGAAISVNYVINALNYRRFPGFIHFFMSRFQLYDFSVIFLHFNCLRGKRLLMAPFSRVTPHVIRGLDVFEREKAFDIGIGLTNFPPCILPGYLHLLSDWERADPGGDERIFHMDGVVKEVSSMWESERGRPPACSRCVYFRRCLGVEREYLAVYGDGEFVPVRRKSRLR